MLKSHEQFYSRNEKRLILVADDEQINLELLGFILQDYYEIIYANDGEEAMRLIKENANLLSLVLMDLMMPKIHGLDVLKWMKAESELQHIPVIVFTSDQSAEVESLKLGAIDFIPKPYPQAEVVLARLQRTIELAEDRDIIQSTERDNLTGLFNREYFYRYAEQYDMHHKDTAMDAIVVDVNHFHIINERYGKNYGNEVLRRIGQKVREMVRDNGGIVCRREADTFLVYCPHGKDYQAILDNAAMGLAGDENASENRIRLRMGIYSNVDKNIDIERRFDRAKLAADTVRNSFSKNIAIYDSKIYEAEIYDEQLMEDFQLAIDQRQFKVFYQPKFNIRSDIPVLVSAEALVRWQHPELGLVSPGVFIPLFEKNGLIHELDRYVWRETAAQIQDWKRRLGITVPVSVNISRIDMYDPYLVEGLMDLIKEFDITPNEFLLEITESAYTQDSEQIIERVNALRKIGFKIEMDDFGTGYSSLSMISALPIDALKLDMMFIRNAFGIERDLRMLEIIIDIADYLGVPTIAEGVETEEQLKALRDMGCDIVQGYYFSRPVPPEEYEVFINDRKKLGQSALQIEKTSQKFRENKKDLVSYVSIAQALSCGFESIYYVDTDTGHYVEFTAQGSYEDLQIENSGDDFFGDTQRNILRVAYPDDITRLSSSMRKDALMAQLLTEPRFSMTYRLVINGQPVYYNLKAIKPGGKDPRSIVIGVSNVDDQARHELDPENADTNSQELYHIAQALSSDFESIFYVNTETELYKVFSTSGAYEGFRVESSGENFFRVYRERFEKALCPEDKKTILELFDKKKLLEEFARQPVLTVTYRMVIDDKPTYYRMKLVFAEERGGSFIVIGISNIDEQVKREKEFAEAREEALRDALTGVKNKRAYSQEEERIDEAISRDEAGEFAIVLCDVNELKVINDTMGHKVGDSYIRAACIEICHTFQHSPVFRIGGDEFAAVLRGADYENRHELLSSIMDQNRDNRQTGGVTIACGLADYIPGKDMSVSTVFERADSLMYENKKLLKTDY